MSLGMTPVQIQAEARRRQREYTQPRGGVEWREIARPAQLPPTDDDWLIWMIKAGRGWGKTRTCAEWVRSIVPVAPQIAIVGATFGDARDYCIEGESGLKAICRRDELTTWNRSIGEGQFCNGARFKLFSGEEPERMRGPNNYAAWCDELASWKYLKQTWDNLMFTMRKGISRTVIGMTPRRQPFVKQIEAMPITRITHGTSYDNLANLSRAFIETIIKPYEGTTLGRQELNAEDLEDVDGALWTRAMLDPYRVTKAPDLISVVTAIDPSATSGGDAAGIVTAGTGYCDCKGPREVHGFVLDDATVQGSPKTWASAAVSAFHKFKADKLVAESNNGGEMVAVTVETIPHAPYVKLIHASRGKHTRAQPVASLYEQGMIHHVGAFAALEDELCSWVPGDESPNRLDALVWAVTELPIGYEAGI